MEDYGEDGAGSGTRGRKRGGGMNQIDESFGGDRDRDGGGGGGGGRGGGGGGRGGGRGGAARGPKLAFNRVLPKFLQQYSGMLERPKWQTEDGVGPWAPRGWLCAHASPRGNAPAVQTFVTWNPRSVLSMRRCAWWCAGWTAPSAL